MSNNTFTLLSLVWGREWILAAALVLNVVLVMVFARFVLREVKAVGWRNVRRDRLYQSGIALGCYFFFMIFARLWALVMLHVGNRGGDMIGIENAYPIAFIASIGAVVCGVFAVKVFAETTAAWKLTVLAMIMFATITTVFI